jgi:hypothetical protein
MQVCLFCFKFMVMQKYLRWVSNINVINIIIGPTLSVGYPHKVTYLSRITELLSGVTT